MTAVRFDGEVKSIRRNGGWSARGVVVARRHDQLFDTLVGPKAFDRAEDAEAWLKQAAKEREIGVVSVVVWA